MKESKKTAEPAPRPQPAPPPPPTPPPPPPPPPPFPARPRAWLRLRVRCWGAAAIGRQVQINRKQVYIRAGVRYRVSPAIHRYHFTPGTQAWKVTAFCMPAGLNVRERPEKGATPVARLSRGGTALSFDPQEDVVRDDKGNEWIHVKTPAGDSGWSMSLLREGATVYACPRLFCGNAMTPATA
eukprot:SAG31_NODE_1460_length_8241_cov_11.816352_8_plen_183_part_00